MDPSTKATLEVISLDDLLEEVSMRHGQGCVFIGCMDRNTILPYARGNPQQILGLISMLDVLEAQLRVSVFSHSLPKGQEPPVG